jgi:hypothetical protein
MASAIAGSQAGDRNQALNTLRLHRIHKDTSGLRKQARSAENVFRVWRYSKRLNDCVNVLQRTFKHPPIKCITVQFLKPGIVQTY